MNQVFLEESSKEKINKYIYEGVRSQEYYRNRENKTNPFKILGKIIFAVPRAILNLPIPKENRPAKLHQQS